MNVTTESLENCEVLMTVEIDDKQADKVLKSAAKRIARQIQIPGFRPGKAPYQMVVRRVGEDAVRSEALEDLGESVFKQALEQVELEPFAPASMEDISWSPLVMKVRVPVDPIVELGDYRDLRFDFEPVTVSDEEIDEALKNLQDERAEWNPVDRPAQLGDRISMSVEGNIGDQVVIQDDDVNYELVEIDQDESRPDLTTPLIGLSAGEDATFSVTYPETFHDSNVAGKEVDFSVSVHGVEEKETFPLDDDFAQMVGDFDTLDDLKQRVTENLREQKQSQADSELASKALDHLVEHAQRLEWHKSLEERMIDRITENQDNRLKQSGLSLDVYLDMQKKSMQDWREDLRPDVQKEAKYSLVLQELAKQEGLSIEGQEISERIELISAMAGEQSADMLNTLASPAGVQQVYDDLLTQKTRDRLVQIVKGELTDETQEKAEEEAEVEPAVAEPSADVE